MPATGSYQQHLSLFKTQTTINRQGGAQGVLLYSKGAFGTVAAAGGLGTHNRGRRRRRRQEKLIEKFSFFTLGALSRFARTSSSF